MPSLRMLSSRALLLGGAALFFAVFFTACSGPASSFRSAREASVVARVDGAPLTLPAFEAHYLRTTGQTRAEAAADSMPAYRDFLERFETHREAYRQPGQPQTFAEARSAVLRDEQDARERALLRRLRRRYAARTYPGRLDQAFEGEPPGTADAARP